MSDAGLGLNNHRGGVVTYLTRFRTIRAQRLNWVKFKGLSRVKAGPTSSVQGSSLLTWIGSTITVILPPTGLENGEYVSVYTFACSTPGELLIQVFAPHIVRHEILAL